MLIPTTSGELLIALVLAALLWGIWANTLFADRKWRFEYYSFDFAFGVLIGAILLAYTIGNAGSGNSFTFDDTLTVAGKRNMATAVAGGAVFCLSNMLIMAGIVLAGMSTALPTAAAMALIVSVLMNASGRSPSNPGLIYGASGVAVAALIASAVAQIKVSSAVPVKKGLHPGWKAFILTVVGGLIGGFVVPVLDASRVGDIGVGAYGAVFFAAIGNFLLTPLCNVFFLNLPVQGDAGSIGGYFKGTKKQHLMGLAGGVLWAAGAVAFFAAVGATFSGSTKLIGIHGAGYAGAVIAGLCGLTIWGDRTSAPQARAILFATLGLLAAACAMLYLGA